MKQISNYKAWAFCIAMLLTTTWLSAQTDTSIPKLIQKNGRYTLLVDNKPFFVLGGQCGNSSNWASMLPNVWNVMKEMHANTLEIPVYWEQLEPQEGKFDFSQVQSVLNQARQNNMRLIFLWFATWKNGSNHYMPEWMKTDSKKYPNVVGKNGQEVDSPSPHCEEAMKADAKAFARFMGYLKEADTQHTVIMVQVENEPGTWGSVRDYSKKAQKLFEGSIPQEILTPTVCKELNVPKNAKGSWKEVFGERADEYFHAWHVARYINYVAKAGKEIYPLPLYINVALRDPLTNPTADHYESGGATDNVISIWKAAAPDIDFVAPDIYLRDDKAVLKVLELYARPDNALMVPETIGSPRFLYHTIAKGIGFSPFGVDQRRNFSPDMQRQSPLSAEYEILKPMAHLLAEWSAEDRIHPVIEPSDHSEQYVNLGSWKAIIKFGNTRGGQTAAAEKRPVNGKAMIIQLGENEFIGIGTNCRFTFEPIGKKQGKAWQYLKVQEGFYDENGDFKMLRILNGDQTDWGGPQVGDAPSILHFTLTTR